MNMNQKNYYFKVSPILLSTLFTIVCLHIFYIHSYAWTNSTYVDKDTISLMDSKTDSIDETTLNSQTDGWNSTTHYYKVTREYPGFLYVNINATMQKKGVVAVSVRNMNMEVLYEEYKDPDNMNAVDMSVTHYLDSGDYYICVGNAYDGHWGSCWDSEKSADVFPSFTYTISTKATVTKAAIDRQPNDSAEYAQYFDHYKNYVRGAFIYGTGDECDYYKINKTDTYDIEFILHYYSSNMNFYGTSSPELIIYDSNKKMVDAWYLERIQDYEYYTYYKIDQIVSGLGVGTYYICIQSDMRYWNSDGVYRLNIVSKIPETNNSTPTNNSQQTTTEADTSKPATTETATTKPVTTEATTKPNTTESAATEIRPSQPNTQTVKEVNYKPRKTKIVGMERVKKGFNISWDYVGWTPEVGDINGYHIQIATNRRFTKNVKNYKVNDRYRVHKRIRKLKRKKKYYVKVRAYKIENGVMYNGNWSKVKSIKTK